MRILDNISDKALDDILILLTKSEAKRMRDAIDQLLAENKLDHEHILDLDSLNREITIALYDEVNVQANPWVERVLDLIRNGK